MISRPKLVVAATAFLVLASSTAAARKCATANREMIRYRPVAVEIEGERVDITPHRLTIHGDRDGSVYVTIATDTSSVELTGGHP